MATHTFGRQASSAFRNAVGSSSKRQLHGPAMRLQRIDPDQRASKTTHSEQRLRMPTRFSQRENLSSMITNGQQRCFSTTSLRRRSDDGSRERDPGGKPIPTDGSYRTVYDDFNNILASEEPQLSVYSMGEDSFTLSDGLVCRSPIILLQNQVFLWNTPVLDRQKAMPNGAGWEAWQADAQGIWSVFEMASPRPEIVIFGTGPTVLPIPLHVRQHLNALGIQVEAHNTRNACSTFNLLSEEQRLVAAALLPDVQKPIRKVAASEKP